VEGVPDLAAIGEGILEKKGMLVFEVMIQPSRNLGFGVRHSK
jgi:hypothetical protein